MSLLKTIIHFVSLFLTSYTLVTYSLLPFIFICTLVLFFFNLLYLFPIQDWCIEQYKLRQKAKIKVQTQQKIKRFQDVLRSKTTIEQQKVYKSRYYHQIDYSLKDQFNYTPMLSQHFQQDFVKNLKQRILQAKQNTNAITQKQLQQLSPQIIKNQSNTLYIKPNKLPAALEIIQQYSQLYIDSFFDQLYIVYKQLNQSLLRSFGLILSSKPKYINQISTQQLRSILRIVLKQKTLPRYSTKMSLPQLIKQAALMRSKLQLLPDLQAPLHMFRLHLLVQWLKHEFPQELFSVMNQGEKDKSKEQVRKKTHEFFGLVSGVVWYGNRPAVKSKSCECVVLGFLLEVFRKYERTDVKIITELNGVVRKNR